MEGGRTSNYVSANGITREIQEIADVIQEIKNDHLVPVNSLDVPTPSSIEENGSTQKNERAQKRCGG